MIKDVLSAVSGVVGEFVEDKDKKVPAVTVKERERLASSTTSHQSRERMIAKRSKYLRKKIDSMDKEFHTSEIV